MKQNAIIQNSSPYIILFESAGEDYLKKLVLFDIKYQVFDPFDISQKWVDIFKAVCSAARSYQYRIFKVLSVNGMKAFFRKTRAILISRQIKKMNPKCVLTFTDNSTIFHMVCEECQGIPFLAIQNGGRYVWCARDACPDPNLKYHIDEYYCFGPQVQRLFEKYNHNIKKYITCGSLVGGYFFSSHPETRSQEKAIYDICYVSQWMPHFSDPRLVPKGWERLNEAIIQVTELLARFAHEQNQVKICVALRRNDVSERDFYDSYFKGKCVFQERARDDFSSYKAVESSKLSVALNSTLLSEAFGAGRKILFINPFGEERLIPTDRDGPWLLTSPTYEIFRNRIWELLEMDENAYQAIASTAMADTMVFNRNRPAHVVLRERLIELVGAEN